jgi:hypothetical protein
VPSLSCRHDRRPIPLWPEEARPPRSPEWDRLDYKQLLIAAQKVSAGTEAAGQALEGEKASDPEALAHLPQFSITALSDFLRPQGAFPESI